MSNEYVIPDSVVACVTIQSHGFGGDNAQNFAMLSRGLKAICQPPRDSIFFFNGQAGHPIYADSDGLAMGCNWSGVDGGAGEGEIVWAPAGQDEARVRLGVKLSISKHQQTAWLTVESNPTTMFNGNNIHPAAFINPDTGEQILRPSSDWMAMSRTFRLGFEFLEAIGGDDLFDAETKAVIERGDFHLVRVQWAAAKEVKYVVRFLQLMTVVYGQTIARGWGVINNASHLGLEFEPFIDRETHQITGLLFRKRHGAKLVFSFSEYNKLERLKQMSLNVNDLSERQQVTVKESVREDITAHSEGILIIVNKARQKLKTFGDNGIKFFEFLAPEVFLGEEPKPTLWWLQRAIFILSHYRQKGRLKRFSFGVWLVPYIEKEVLHFDVIAKITAEGFHRVAGLRDPVAIAWRSDKSAGGENWADRLAKVAKCSPGTVRNRRALWRKEIGIDISLPFQFYADILHFGQSSMASPAQIVKMLAAAKGEDGDSLVRLYTDALANFEDDRRSILNPALLSNPRAMMLEGPRDASPEPDEPRRDADDGEPTDASVEAEEVELIDALPEEQDGGEQDVDGEEFDDRDLSGRDPDVEFADLGEELEDLSLAGSHALDGSPVTRPRKPSVPTIFKPLKPSKSERKLVKSVSRKVVPISVKTGRPKARHP